MSNDANYTIFKLGNNMIRFRAPYSLERYTEVKEWDKGYLVVKVKYSHNETEEEEYIDLIPILEALYFDIDEFINRIGKVRISYEGIFER